MPFTAVAKTEYFADELAEIIDLPSSFRGHKVVFKPISVPEKSARKSVMDLPKYKLPNLSIETLNELRADRI